MRNGLRGSGRLAFVLVCAFLARAEAGVASEPYLVKDIAPGPEESWPENFTAAGNRVFFTANDGSHGFQLWVSDGTEEGTRLVREIGMQPGSEVFGGPHLGPMTAVGDRVFFVIDDGLHGRELWVSDGTAKGTRLVKDIRPGPLPTRDEPAPQELTAVGDRLYFTADDGTHGVELWVSDGTEDGTRLAGEVRPGREGVIPWRLTAAGDLLFFLGDDGIHGTELWVAGAALEGTVPFREVVGRPPGWRALPPVLAGGRHFFTADDGTRGSELWVSDLTAGGTDLVIDLRPGPEGSSPYELEAMGDRVFFTADDGTHGWQVWVSDGSADGTRRLSDLLSNGHTPLQGPEQLTAAGDRIFFTNGAELWVSDGTAGGTRLVSRIFNDRAYCGPGWGPRSPFGLIAAGERVIFYAVEEVSTGFSLSEEFPVTLWLGTGTPEGTGRIGDLGSWCFSAGCEGGGCRFGIPTLLHHQGRLFFSARDDLHGAELWALDLHEDSHFRRGDCNGDGEVGGSVSDAVFLLSYSFLGGRSPPCLAACDANGDGNVTGQVGDAVYLLQFNFLGGPAPPAPFPGCGPLERGTDRELGCAETPRACGAARP